MSASHARRPGIRRVLAGVPAALALFTALLVAGPGLGTASADINSTFPAGTLLVADASAFEGVCWVDCGGVIAVNPATGLETAVSDNAMAINADSQFMNGPFTLALDPNGDIIVGETDGLGGSCPSDLLCGGLVEVDPATGKQTVLSDNTMAINADSQYFGQVNGVTINAAGQIFVSDWGGCQGCGKVIEVDPSDGRETLISSNTQAINDDSQFLQYPQGLTLGPDGTIYVADATAFGTGGGIVAVNPTTGKQTEVSSNEMPINASNQDFTGIGGLVFDSAGDILAADWGGGQNPGKIVQVDPSTGAESIFSSNSMPVNADTQYFNEPAGITVDSDGNVYVADEGAFDCQPTSCGGIIEVNPVTRAETAVSYNGMAVNQPDPLFVQPWDVLVVPSEDAPSQSAPVSTAAPSITGRAAVGEKLTASPGTWNPSDSAVSYSWQRSSDGGQTWTPISKASAASYVPTSADVGAELRVSVTAKDEYGVTTATSAAAGPVRLDRPALSVAPVISGAIRNGHALKASTGSWTPAPSSFGYAWQRTTNGSTWKAIGHATRSSYTPTRADIGARLRVVVTATNSAGSAHATSNATAAYCPAGHSSGLCRRTHRS